MSNKTVTINTREVPVNLRNEFKIFCAKQQVSMQDALIAMMEIAVQKNVKIKQRVHQINLKKARLKKKMLVEEINKTKEKYNA